MASAADHCFAHRRNQDGSIDSICTHCFITIATSEFSHELLQAERIHVCNPRTLEHFARGKLEGRNEMGGRKAR